MFQILKNRFGIPGVIAAIALVFAMIGGAYAASNEGGNATASAKAKKGPRGPKGPKGDTGAAGPQGLAGPKGDAGANGSSGKDGTSGTNGTNGTSAEAISFSGEAHGCKEGGIEVKSAKPVTFVCNGVKGQNGTTGFTETLPSGKTETGVWSVLAPAGEVDLVDASFNIPLGSDLPGSNVIFIPEGEEEDFEVECPGSAEEPKAAKGFACFYTLGVLTEKKPKVIFGPITTRQGVTFEFLGEEEKEAFALGTWAVTAE